MKLLTFQRRAGSQRAGLLLPGNRVIDLAKALTARMEASPIKADDTVALLDSLRVASPDLLDIIGDRGEGLAELRTVEQAAEQGSMEAIVYPLGDTPLLAPIPVPPVVGLVAPGGPAGAPAWSFAPGTAVLGSAAEACVPAGEEHLDVEARLAVWVARPLHGATPTQGEAAILGYSVAAVLVARDLAATSPAAALAVGMVVGPWITTADEVDDPMGAQLRLRRNKEVVAEGAPNDAIFAPGEMLALISNYTPLCAGAVLLVGTGATPVARGLVAGDQVEVSAGELGSVRLRIT